MDGDFEVEDDLDDLVLDDNDDLGLPKEIDKLSSSLCRKWSSTSSGKEVKGGWKIVTVTRGEREGQSENCADLISKCRPSHRSLPDIFRGGGRNASGGSTGNSGLGHGGGPSSPQLLQVGDDSDNQQFIVYTE